MIEYPAIISHDQDEDVYNVSFPDLPGCVTYGDSLEEAMLHAKEALTGFLESIDSRKIKIPKPSNPTGEEVFYIQPEKNVAFAIWLKQKREEKGFTQEQIAVKLRIAYQTYQRFEDPAKSNPTLKTITRLEEVLNEKVLQV